MSTFKACKQSIDCRSTLCVFNFACSVVSTFFADSELKLGFSSKRGQQIRLQLVSVLWSDRRFESLYSPFSLSVADSSACPRMYITVSHSAAREAFWFRRSPVVSSCVEVHAQSSPSQRPQGFVMSALLLFRKVCDMTHWYGVSCAPRVFAHPALVSCRAYACMIILLSWKR